VIEIVSGWTGTGKSTIADIVAADLAGTVVSFDWVMLGLRSIPEVWPHIEHPADRQRSVGWSLMGRLIEQQIRRGGSAVADLVARQEPVDEWKALAATYECGFVVVECVCSDADVHRARVDGRTRSIPGWYELTWAQVIGTRESYAPLDEPKLVIDAVDALGTNLVRVRRFLDGAGRS
jgi:predicted kinase